MGLYEVRYRQKSNQNALPTMAYVVLADSQWDALQKATELRKGCSTMTWHSIENLDTREAIFLTQVRAGAHLTGMYKGEKN